MSMRVSFVGAGSVAQRHVSVLRGLDGFDVEVVGVFDPSREAAEKLAAGCGATACASIEEALDAGPVDAAYVCVPPFAHGEAEKAVLARRLPMFVEKPVGADLVVAEEVGRLVTDAGVVTGTGYHWRCLDTVARVQQRLADSPALLASGYWLDKRPPVAWWPSTDRSGGQVVEQVTHVLDLARVLLGEAVEVYAAGTRRDEAAPGDDVDDATAATVRFASGAVATLAATSLLTAKHRAALHLFGTGLVTEVAETSVTFDDGGSREIYEPAEDPRVVVDREFLEAVRGERESTRAPYTEALASHRLGCAVAESARTGLPVSLDAQGRGAQG